MRPRFVPPAAPKGPDRGAEPDAWRMLLRVLELRPAAAARILGVSEREMALWVTGQALHPGGPAGQAEAAGRLIDAVQASRRAA